MSNYFKLTIDSLPDKILIEIFNYLDEATLVSASKCCMRFDDLIRNDVSLMNKIEYAVIMMESDKQFKVFKAFEEGKYQNLFFGSSRNVGKVLLIPKVFLEDIKKYENSLRKITFTDVTTSACVEVLSNLELTNTLIVSNLRENQEQNVHLPHLKHLEVYESFEFINSIKSHNLETFKVYESENLAVVNDFLKTCENLKEFSIATNQFHSVTFYCLNFTLTKLSLKNVSLNDESLLKFLKLQKETLRELSIVNEKQNYFIRNSMEFILSQMSLNYFEVNMNCVPNLNCLANETIQSLVIWDLYIYNTSLGERLLRFEKILTICGKVKGLTILECQNLNEFLQVASRVKPYLKILKLHIVPYFLSPIINFDSLEHLEIDLIVTERQFEVLPYLVAYCGNLKVLKVNEFKNDENVEESLLKKILLSAKKLEEVYVGIKSDFPDSIKLIMQQMKNCGSRLRVLKSKTFKLPRDSKRPVKYEISSLFSRNDFKCYASEVERNYSMIKEKCAYLAHEKTQWKYFSD